MATTTRYGLTKIDPNDLVKNGPTVVNGTLDQIDAAFAGTSNGPRSSRPPSTGGSPGIAGRFYRSTDTGQVDRDTGTGWQTVVPALVSSLPGSPDDGQIVDYIVDATNGIVWRLRYRAASASAFKWEFVGGAPLATGEQANSQTLTLANTWTKLTHTSAPSLTIPNAGDYEMVFGAQLAGAGTADVHLAPLINNVNPADNSTSVRITSVANAYLERRIRLTGLTAGQNLALTAETTATGVIILYAAFSLRPIRLS